MIRMAPLFLLLSLFSSFAQALCVTNDNVSLRAKPDGDSRVTWIVGKYMPLVEVSRKGPWIQVADVDNVKHWIHARNVSSRMDCVVVRSKLASLRLGPGPEYFLTDLGAVRKYATFRKVGRDDAWLKLQDDYGQIYWVHENNLWEPRTYARVHF